jgi:hypothetical protein
LNKDLKIDKAILKDSIKASSLCHYQAGATIEEVQEFLWPTKDRETDTPEKHRYLPNVTSGVGLSLAGTLQYLYPKLLRTTNNMYGKAVYEPSISNSYSIQTSYTQVVTSILYW